MKNVAISILAFAFILFVQCKTSQVYTMKSLPESYIAYGSFGGFSGNITMNYILPNGQIIQTQSISNDTLELTPIKQGKAKKIYRHLRKLNFETIKGYAPGNMTYFITQYIGGKEHSVVWGENGDIPPPEVKKLNTHIQKALNQEDGNNKTTN